MNKQWVIYPAVYLAAQGVSFMGLGLVFYLRDIFHCTPVLIGRLMAVHFLCYVTSCLCLQPRVKQVNPIVLVTLATGVAALAFMGMLWTRQVGLMFILVAIIGVALSLFWPPIVGWLSQDTEGERLGRLTMRFNTAWSTAATAGPWLCGWLYEMSPPLPLLGAGLSFGVAFLMLALTLYRTTEPWISRSGYETISGTFQGNEGGSPYRWPGWLGLFICFFGAGALVNIFPQAARQDFHFTESLIGLLLLMRACVNWLSFLVLGRLTFWHFRGWPMVAGLGVMALAYVGLMFVASPWTIGALFLVFGFTSALSYSQSLFHGIAGSQNRTRRMAIHEAMLGAGLVLGSLAGSAMFQYGSARHVYALCAGAMLLAMVIQYRLCQRAQLRLNIAPEPTA